MKIIIDKEKVEEIVTKSMETAFSMGNLPKDQQEDLIKRRLKWIEEESTTFHPKGNSTETSQ